jgi:hypothetical protein
MTPSKHISMVKVGCTYHGTLGVLLSFKKPASNVYTAVYSEYRVQRILEIWGGGLILGLPRNPRIFSLHEFGYRADNFSPLNRTKEFSTVDSPLPRQVQESRDSTIDIKQSLVLSRLSCACVGKGDSSVLNSFVRLRGLKFLAQEVQKSHFSVQDLFSGRKSHVAHKERRVLRIRMNFVRFLP